MAPKRICLPETPQCSLGPHDRTVVKRSQALIAATLAQITSIGTTDCPIAHRSQLGPVPQEQLRAMQWQLGGEIHVSRVVIRAKYGSRLASRFCTVERGVSTGEQPLKLDSLPRRYCDPNTD